MRKVVTVVGTRPELIKLSLVIKELDEVTNHVFVHTGQNYDYELNGIFFRDLEIRKPDYFLNAAGDSPADTIANVISYVDKVLQREQPEAMLIYGDTNSCLSMISAKRRKIPVFHMEAGNRCFDQNVPEELNRTIVDHISDINLTITEHGRRYLIAEGINPETVMKIGSTMPEILARYDKQISESPILGTFSLQPKQYIVVSAHREENVDNPKTLRLLLESISAIATEFEMPVLFSVHPRTRKRMNGSDFKLPSGVMLLKPLGFIDYIQLQKNALCVASDSGTITEESSLLGFPAIMLRSTHERPEGMDVATVLMAGLNPAAVLDSIRTAVRHAKAGHRPQPVDDYRSLNVSKTAVRIILSYIDYVNTYIWRKC